MMYAPNNNPHGMIALTTVLLVGAIVLVAGIGMTTRSIMSGQTVSDTERSMAAMAVVTGCMEQALWNLFQDVAYTGDETLTIGDDSCILLPIESPSSLERVIKASATVDGFTRKIRVHVTSVTPPMTVGSWEDVADF